MQTTHLVRLEYILVQMWWRSRRRAQEKEDSLLLANTTLLQTQCPSGVYSDASDVYVCRDRIESVSSTIGGSQRIPAQSNNKCPFEVASVTDIFVLFPKKTLFLLFVIFYFDASRTENI